MTIIRAKDYDDMSAKAARLFYAQIIAKPDSILGLATGSTAFGVYKRLIKYYQRGELDFSGVKTFNLDEYAGLSENNDQSYRCYMDRNFFNKINIKKENTHLPDGEAKDLYRECERYNTLIGQLGRTDIQLLGLGQNGHIGFNEPGGSFIKDTHVVDLNENTIEANARFFANRDEVPRKALTIGIGNIMRAKRVVLCVSGAKKAAALKAVLCGPISPQVPGSVLQLHNDCIVIADTDALNEYEENRL